MGIRDKGVTFLHNAGILDMVDLYNRLMNKSIKILAYHRVMDIDEMTYNYDEELISASCSDFDWQMDYLNKNYNPISMQGVINCVIGNEEFPKKPIVVTFDDGFVDNYENAFPILKKYNVPATFFVSTGYINSNNIYWFDMIAYIIKARLIDVIPIPNMNGDLKIPTDRDSRKRMLKEVLSYLKNVNDVEREFIIGEFRAGVSNKDIQKHFQSQSMTWEQLKEMSKNNMDIQSHTVSHPILSQLSKDKIEAELINSKNEIENKIGTACNVLAYPSGKPSTFNSDVINIAQNSGYKMATAYVNGDNYIKNMNHFSLNRIAIERYINKTLFKSLLKAPWTLT